MARRVPRRTGTPQRPGPGEVTAAAAGLPGAAPGLAGVLAVHSGPGLFTAVTWRLLRRLPS